MKKLTQYNFSDKVVLVTGSSRGIGRSTAIMFAEAGAHVIVHFVNDSKLGLFFNEGWGQCLQFVQWLQ